MFFVPKVRPLCGAVLVMGLESGSQPKSFTSFKSFYWVSSALTWCWGHCVSLTAVTALQIKQNQQLIKLSKQAQKAYRRPPTRICAIGNTHSVM